MKARKLITAAMTVILCLNLMMVNAAAATNPTPEIQPFWVNASAVTSTLSISGTTAGCDAKVTGYSGTTKINSTLKLYRQVGTAWYLVNTWTKNVSTTSLTYSESCTVTTGYNYKLVVEADVYTNGVWETVSKESSVKYCG